MIKKCLIIYTMYKHNNTTRLESKRPSLDKKETNAIYYRLYDRNVKRNEHRRWICSKNTTRNNKIKKIDL
jgi:hypothetical protein